MFSKCRRILILLLGVCSLGLALNSGSRARWDAQRSVFDLWNPETQVVEHYSLQLERLGEKTMEATPEWVAQSKSGADGILVEDFCAGRRLLFDSDSSVLRLSLATWETGGHVEWGPSWAAIRFRVAQPMGVLEWQMNQGEIRRVAFQSDRRDPLTQRAYLEGIFPGQSLRIRHRPCTARHPKMKWEEWQTLLVPEVDPLEPQLVEPLKRFVE